MGDTLSIKVYQALASALEMRPDRRVILSRHRQLPVRSLHGRGADRGRWASGHELRTVAPEDVADHITDDIAVLMLTEVDYRTGRLHDMPALTAKAHAAGALTVWDLAHSRRGPAGRCARAQRPISRSAAPTNTSMPAPARPPSSMSRRDTPTSRRPALSGWLGHDAPFAFDLDYRPGARHRPDARRHPAGAADWPRSMPRWMSGTRST